MHVQGLGMGIVEIFVWIVQRQRGKRVASALAKLQSEPFYEIMLCYLVSSLAYGC